MSDGKVNMEYRVTIISDIRRADGSLRERTVEGYPISEEQAKAIMEAQ